MKRRYYDYRFDTTNEILVLRWNDNANVKMSTNYETIDPLRNIRRFDRKTKKMTAYHKPHTTHSFNQVWIFTIILLLIIVLAFEEVRRGGHFSHMQSILAFEEVRRDGYFTHMQINTWKLQY